ncbi:MAG: bifunctional acetate--CoA ligase family protein/GNAT family N-acetyltransferase, partial [Alphaproteobacteria bacterium]|nr:bifunctional acetate--CoA ligase family protein/GNAT family N-acetyltransferase [Alphaproteobacteria bacterium]
KNLLAGGFEGPIMPVSPHHEAISGMLAYPDVASLPMTPDLAVICTPPQSVPGLVGELAKRGAKGAVVITAGFNELGTEQGRALERAMLEAAKTNLMRIIGPNCLGILSTGAGLNASFAPVPAHKGGVAFVAQSGAMLTTILDWATARGIGFSHLVSLGDMTDVDFGDMLDYLALDPNTHSILLYIETITHARKFMSAARGAARLKPVIAIKAGRHAAAAKAASSHTGAMAGVDAVYDAAFQRAGILRVQNLDDVFDAVETLALPVKVAGDRLLIVTNGGGLGVLATDALLDHEDQLAPITDGMMAKLDAILPPTWSHGNPIDIIGDATPKRYGEVMAALMDAPAEDSILVLNCPVAVASSGDAAQAVADAVRGKRKPVLASWLGSDSAAEAHRIFAEAGVPAYDTPDKAIRGYSYLVRYNRGQQTLMEVPPSLPEDFVPDEARARAVIEAALDKGENWLDEPEVHELLDAYGIANVRSKLVATDEEAVAYAATLGGKVALKIFSPDITHKSDVGGVVLDLEGPDEVREAAAAMRARVAKAAPQAKIAGFIVQEMIRRPGSHELILGMAVDAQFGPFLLFGHGGTAAEVIGDKALALPPLNMALAKETMARTRIYRQLQGYRDIPPAALDAIALTLVRLSQMITDIAEIGEFDINPLLADAKGVMALDARVKLVKPGRQALSERFCISPYPKELEHREQVEGMGAVLLRPVKPEDAPALAHFFEQLSPEDMRMRFFTAMRALPPALLARLTQIDYDREMAFLLVEKKTGEILGGSRYSADPDNTRAEFAISVRSNLKGRGLGRLLMQRLIAYARKRGTGEMFGDVLEENVRMLALCRELGFTVAPQAEMHGVMRASVKLS